MAASPAKSEATDAPATFTYDGHSYTVAPSKAWPLEALDAFEADKVATCVRHILGDEQWRTFRATPRTVGDLNTLFDAVQKAAGFEGKLTALAALVRDHPDAVEADLQRFYGVDLADLWRGELSWRRLSVLVAHLPAGSAVWACQHGVDYGLTLTDVLIADLYEALTGTTHPVIAPMRRTAAASSEAARASALRARLLAQRERLAST